MNIRCGATMRNRRRVLAETSEVVDDCHLGQLHRVERAVSSDRNALLFGLITTFVIALADLLQHARDHGKPRRVILVVGRHPDAARLPAADGTTTGAMAIELANHRK